MRVRRLVTAAFVLLAVACEDASGPEPMASGQVLVFGAIGLEGYGDGIFRADQDGTGVERISDQVPEGLAVSPDGDRVAFIAFVPGEERSSAQWFERRHARDRGGLAPLIRAARQVVAPGL